MTGEDTPTWDILVCTIPHRHAELLNLLGEFARQWRPGIRVLIHRTDIPTPAHPEHGYGPKCQHLLESATGDYVSWFDDDDWPAPHYVARITQALRTRPDHVGFRVRWSIDGTVQVPVEHSLRHDGWANLPHILTRDITHFNPIRRDLALLGRWEGGNGAERGWAAGIRATGRCRREEWIDEEMHHYRSRSSDTFLTPREPWRGPLPPLPEHPWLVVL